MGKGEWYERGPAAVEGEADSVPTTALQDEAVTAAKIADLGVTTGKIAAGAVTEAKLADGAVAAAKLGSDVSPVQVADVTIPTGEVLALNAEPKTIVASPGAGFALVPAGPVIAVLHLDYATTAYDGIAAGEDLAFRYDSGTGTQLATVEATGFLDQANDEVRFVAEQALVAPEADAPIVLHMLAGEIATGDSPLLVRFYYRVVAATLA